MSLKSLDGKNGLSRDLAKLGNGVWHWKHSPAIRAALARPLSFHNTTNICVESCRDENYHTASYLAGHVLMVSLCANVFGLIGTLTYVVWRLV